MVPEGGAMVAVLAMLPEAPAVPVTVKVTEPPEGKVGMMMPVPCSKATVVLGVVGQTAPPVVVVQLTAVTVRLATAGSVKMALLAAEGPALLTTMV